MDLLANTVDTAIKQRYKLVNIVGKGAYGEVWKSIDTKTNNYVALKRCFDAFRNSADAQRTYREVMYLQQLSGHDNIVSLYNVFKSDNRKDVYLIFEYFETDLSILLNKNILGEIHKQFIFYQLLRALKYIHSAHIIHRDIKPANLLLNSDCRMSLCDFGLCRSFDIDESNDEYQQFTDYVATRWYRAPELLVGSRNYTKSIDSWSCGLLLAEMLLETTLFVGNSTLNQLEIIFSVLGFPNEIEISSFRTPNVDILLDCINVKEFTRLEDMLVNVDHLALDLIKRFLVLNSNERITVDEALNHPYLSKFHNSLDEPICKVKPSMELSDDIRYEVEKYRFHLFHESDKRKVKI